MNSGIIFDIKRFAIHDGPGVRTTVFFKGCPLSCWACHNPEGQSSGIELFVRTDRCNLCGDCVAVCRSGAISLDDNALEANREICELSGSCTDACLAGALELVGREVSVAQVIEEIQRDTVFYDESGGGVTFSGGEPLYQPAFLLDLLRECARHDIPTTVDTSGYAPRQLVRAIDPLVDLFLYDLKLIDEARHITFTGVSNGAILGNLRWLSERRTSVIVRMPLLTGINDDQPNVSALAEFVGSLAQPYPVDILPYHRIGLDKYSRLGRPYRLRETEPPPGPVVARTVATLAEHGITVTVRGETYAVE